MSLGLPIGAILHFSPRNSSYPRSAEVFFLEVGRYDQRLSTVIDGEMTSYGRSKPRLHLLKTQKMGKGIKGWKSC